MNSISIEWWAPSRLQASQRTLRKNDHAVKRMMASIGSYGFKIPVLVTVAGEIIDGDLRFKAAQALGLKEVPVIVCDDWTPEQVRGFRLMANRSATWAEWDWKSVAEELAELSGQDYDLRLSGFDSREIESLLRPQEDPGSFPPPADKSGQTISTRGDVWQLGDHRVLCGDATKADDVSQILDAAVPVLMITDPPYGVHYDPQWREQAGLGVQRQTGRVQNDDRVDWSEAFALFPGGVAYVWHAGLYASEVACSLERCGFEIRSQIIWAKQHFALSRGHYHWQHEPCWYAVRQGGSGHWCGDRKQSTLWEVSNLNPFGGGNADTVTGHGTQKPVELMRRPMLNHTEPGEPVYDPFLGSGTTLMAAEETGRVCYGIEIDPAYVDVIAGRWQKLTGRQAIRESDGRKFTELHEASRAEDEEEVSLPAAA
jgi:DNA modification methylase